MSDSTKNQNEFKVTYGSVFKIIGFLITTSTIISLVKSGFDFKLFGFPKVFMEHYVYYRDILFSPIVWIVGIFGIHIANYVKDGISLYFIFGAAILPAQIQYYTRMDDMLNREDANIALGGDRRNDEVKELLDNIYDAIEETKPAMNFATTYETEDKFLEIVVWPLAAFTHFSAAIKSNFKFMIGKIKNEDVAIEKRLRTMDNRYVFTVLRYLSYIATAAFLFSCGATFKKYMARHRKSRNHIIIEIETAH